MNETGFSFSVNAQNVQAEFYNKTAVVYVEGRDDVIFWGSFFNPDEYEIKDVGGCEELNKKIEEIQNQGLKCIVACDSDYRYFIKDKKDHPLLVTTNSHSIECVMYCTHNINECIKTLSRNYSDHTKNIEDAFLNFEKEMKEMLAFDIANNINELGESILGDSCSRFLTSKNSITINSKEISNFLSTKSATFNGINIEEIKTMIDSDPRQIRQIIKGHFLTSFVRNLIKKEVMEVNGTCPPISDEMLYALLIHCPPSCAKECEERTIIQSNVSRALEYLKTAS